MALSLAQKFINLGMASPLAVEYSSQINTGAYNWKRLMWLGMVPDLAKYVTTSINNGNFDPRKAMELSMTEAVANLTKSTGVASAIATAYGKYRRGEKNLVIGVLGSSTARGEKGGNGSTNQYINGPFDKAAAGLRTKGERSRCGALFGSGRADPLSTELEQRDPRVILTGNWYTDPNISLGGRRLRATSSANIALTPQETFNSIREYHQTFNTAGSATINVDGGPSLGTIDRNTGVDGVASVNFSTSLGQHTINLALATGSFSCLGLRPYRSDQTEIEFLNFAAGSMSINMTEYDPANGISVSPFNTLSAITDMDLFVMMTGRNEWNEGSSISQMTARMSAYGDKAVAMGGAVCIVTMAATAEYIARNGAAYIQAQRDLAASKGWILVDGNVLFGPYNAAAPWSSGDGVHLNDIGLQMYANEFNRVVFGKVN